MNAPGILLIVLGAWVVTQVLGGNALERLGVVKPDKPEEAGPSTLAPGPLTPAQPGGGSGSGGGSGGLPGAGGW